MRRVSIWLMAILDLAVGAVTDAGKIIVGVVGISLAIGTFTSTVALMSTLIMYAWIASGLINGFKAYKVFKGLLGK